MEKLLKLDPGNTELLAQKHKLLGQAVSETKEKLETLKAAQEQANEALRNGTISQEQYDGLQREIIETENELRRLEEQANQSATALQKISATGEKLKTAGDKISSAGTKLLPVTGVVAGLGTAAVKTAADFNLYVHYGAQSIYGPEIPMTAMGVTMKVFVVIQCAILGLATGAQPILGYNFGNKQYKRVKDAYKLVLSLSALILALATLVFQLAPMSIVRLFGSDDPLYMEFAVKCLRVFLMLVILDVFQITGTVFLQSLGKPIRAAILTILRQIVISIPAMMVLGAIFGVEGILYAGPVSMVLTAIVAVMFLGAQWKQLSESEKKA